MKTLTAFSLALLFLAACAGVAPTVLQPVTVDRAVSLAAPVQYDEYYRMAGNRFHYTIAAGRYVARYQDAGGVYFEGPAQCFSIRIASDRLAKDGKPQPAPHSYRCGLYLPQQDGAEPKVYFYRDPAIAAELAGGVTVQAVDAKGAPATAPAAAVGAAAGAGLARAFDAAELKNLHFNTDQPKPGQLRAALR